MGDDIDNTNNKDSSNDTDNDSNNDTNNDSNNDTDNDSNTDNETDNDSEDNTNERQRPKWGSHSQCQSISMEITNGSIAILIATAEDTTRRKQPNTMTEPQSTGMEDRVLITNQLS